MSWCCYFSNTNTLIKSLSQDKYIQLVHEAIIGASLSWLNCKKMGRDEQSNMKPSSFRVISNPTNWITQKKLLFSMRSRMVDFRENYRFKYNNDTTCRLCLSACDKTVEHNDIFSIDLDKETSITFVFEEKYKRRCRLWK